MSSRNTCTPVLMRLHPTHVNLIPAHVQGGFPSPAEDLPHQIFDLGNYLSPNAEATFFLRVSGDSMRDAGIPHGSLIVVDRSIPARHGHIVVAVVDGDFTVKQLELQHGRCRLLPANHDFPAIELQGEQELEVWGVVRASVVNQLGTR